MEKDIVARLREFIENEGKSCSMDLGGITPEYVYRMWGGSVPMEEIEKAMKEINGWGLRDEGWGTAELRVSGLTHFI